MTFTATTPNSAGAWRTDVYEFAPADVIPDALILQCTTVGADVEGDAPAVRVAYIDDDQAQLSAEGDEIPEAAPELAERIIYTSKITSWCGYRTNSSYRSRRQRPCAIGSARSHAPR